MSFATLLTDLAKDLPGVDLGLIERDIHALEGLKSRKDAFFQLSLRCADKTLVHQNWAQLSGRVRVVEIRENCATSFSVATKEMGVLLNAEYSKFVEDNATKLDGMIVGDRDFMFDTLGVSTLIESYLARLKSGGKTKVVETPQYMYLRVATFLWFPNIDAIKRTYDDMSLGNYSHASPTLFNAGMKRHQMSSCFLMSIEDSTKGLSKGWHDCAIISMNCGGIGCDYSGIRHSEIGHHGQSRGILPWLRIKNEVLCAIDQGGKRKGSGTMYLADWHIDIFEFLDLRKNSGPESNRARDLFYAMWISDLFMKRVLEDGPWSLFCPNRAKGLVTSYGREFEELYQKYEKEEGVVGRRIKARELWQKIILSQCETGMPFMLYKDPCNRKSNQKNMGTIRCSNLCVAGDTKILTLEGELPIRDCVGKYMSVWNGHEWSVVQIRKTGEDQNLLRIGFSNGSTLDCTYYHKFFVTRSDEEVPALLLRVGDSLKAWSLPKGDKVENIRVVLVTEGPRGVDTFCFTEPKRHAGIFNGVLTGQCVEIVEYTDEKELASCNLASISLNACIEGGLFRFDKLEQITRDLVRNINQVIDRNYYPSEVPEIEYSNKRSRPIGIGYQGLADVFAILDMAWEDEAARRLNYQISEAMYFAAVQESIAIAKEVGPYDCFHGSPASQGKFQFDLADEEERELGLPSKRLAQYERHTLEEWDALRHDMKKYGLRNSLLIALMPTASTAHIRGNQSSFDPVSQLVMSRTILAGQYIVVNKYLARDLERLELWNTSIVRKLIADKGSVQGLEVPDLIKRKYKTAYELPQKTLLQYSIDRSRFVCQSQSLNCWMTDISYEKLTSYHFFGWSSRIKTGMYYLRQKAAVDPINFSLDTIVIPEGVKKGKKRVCNEEICVSCQS